jgi:hypothetical protein
MRRVVIGLALLVAVPLCAAPAPAREDYQKKAAEAPWAWSDERATAEGCAKRLTGAYRAEVEPRGMFGGVLLRIAKDGAVVHFFEAGKGTVFAVRDDVLYYADYQPSSSGCAVAAYDLRKKKQLWKANLKGLGPIKHFKYHNAVNLDLEKQAVCVRGKESAGRYIEFVDLKTGKTVGNKVYPRD